ncbi:MAG TPA: glycosyltransferase family 4 protein [Thermoanaerobaculia bacterium]|nr:glycosyltransferase family 4 protein [Thermoanaerobaculia bacterium]
MRIAYLSPLPPMRSGIADYSAELLPELARHLEVELIVPAGFRPAAEVAAGFAVRSEAELPALLAGGHYDAALYHLGNNRDYHASIYSALLEHPGVVMLHELVLHHLVRDLTLYAGDPEGYARELRYAYGRSGEALARRCLATSIPLDPWRYPLFERVVDRSLGMLVHNDYCRSRLLASRPLARVATVPHHLSLGDGPLPEREAARAALGIPPAAFAVASFGFLTAAKRPQVLLRAFARFRREAPQACLLLVGEVSPHYDFASLIEGELAGLMAGVTVTGRLEKREFLLYMAAADLAVNLRHPTGGETSGTLIRLLGLGKPVIVSRTGAFAEIPEDCCAQVDLDDTEEELLLAYLRRLAADEPLRRQMADNARRYAASHHSLAASARLYAEFLRQTAAERPAPFAALPPLAPYPEVDVFSDLLLSVSAELSDLGISEADDEALGAVAAAMVELGLDEAGR